MHIHTEVYQDITQKLKERNVQLVAVSKIQPVTAMMEMYQLGQRDFGENYVQELVDKQEKLPQDVRWHFIGHLQSNKVKYIVPFVYLIQGVDSFKLLKEINKQSAKINKVSNVLLQIHIANEETKFGLNEAELNEILEEVSKQKLLHVKIKGLMGMASFTDNVDQVEKEFATLKAMYDGLPHNEIIEPEYLSMGMSGDYELAIKHGSNMVRIGSLLFGARIYNNK